MKFLLDEKRIQYALYSYLTRLGHKLVVPNVSWSYLFWEADLVSITKSNYLHEFEIKITKSDFEADFKKKKHWFFKTSTSHGHRIPVCFWYVAPIKAIPLCIPDYAGLIQVIQNKDQIFLAEIKKPKRFHSRKLMPRDIESISRTLMFKYWGLSQKLESVKLQRGLLLQTNTDAENRARV